MFVTNWISTTKIQKISEITNFFRHYFLSRTEVRLYTEKSPAKLFYSFAGDSARERFIYVFKKLTHSFMAPKSMSSEVENIELKSKEKNNTDKLNLSVFLF